MSPVVQKNVVVVGLTLGLTLAFAACPGAQKIGDKLAGGVQVPAIVGKFANEGCLAAPQADGTTNYMKLAFDMTPTTWGVDVAMFGDEACSTKLGTIHIDGPYTITGASTAVPGAFEGEFGFAHRTITPHVDGFVALMQSLSCGKAPYAVNEPQDVLEAGCPDMGFPPVSACAKDFDLVKIDGDAITFGARPADNNMCTPDKRPTALQTTLYKRVP